MSESKLFPQPVPKEFYTGHEDTPQRQYVNELAAHVETIPDLLALPSYYSPSNQEADLLSKYCSDFMGPDLERKGVTQLFRDDIIDPHFCRSVDELSRRAAGTRTERHWYSPAYMRDTNRFMENQTKFTSQRWEMFFVGYMRQRRAFHAAFMNALIIKEPIDANVEAIGVQDGRPIEVPSTEPNRGGTQTAPDFLYDKTNWVTASLLSALSLPPENCDAGMKRHAIEQWAAHADLGGDRDVFDFYGLEDRQGADATALVNAIKH